MRQIAGENMGQAGWADAAGSLMSPVLYHVNAAAGGG